MMKLKKQLLEEVPDLLARFHDDPQAREELWQFLISRSKLDSGPDFHKHLDPDDLAHQGLTVFDP